MLEIGMKEKLTQKLEINNPEITFQIYKYMIQWIYEGECDVPDSVSDLLVLIKLTDEYLLEDL
jgi:hypothetical protein